MVIQRSSLLQQYRFTIFALLTCIKLAEAKEHGQLHVESFYGPYLEVTHIILITFHWLAHKHMATPNCKEEWKMLPNFMSRKKKQVW